MIPELGTFALILALCLGLLSGFSPVHATTSTPQFIRFTIFGQLGFILFAYLCLSIAFVTNDFSVLYVASNSSRELPAGYRLTAVWGGHEGSMLLWVLILALWTSAVALFKRDLPQQFWHRILVVMAWVSVGFLLFILAVSNPFLRILPEYPDNGADLMPLLQDPGFFIHPPMLYMGYVGFSVAFAFALAALWVRKIDPAWTQWVRPWTLAAWCFLTLGITLGSWWAYRVLGWGGWWFWDPVENASFLPWLAGTALIHSLLVTEKRAAFKSWTVLLAIITFCLSLLGAFLVRSGVLISVHAFAVDPNRGVFMLVFLLLVVGISLLLYMVRGTTVRSREPFNIISRETFLLMNNLLLLTALVTVLLGTLYPLIIEALGVGKLSVGAPYFNAVFVPLIAPLLFFMGIGPQCNWQAMRPDLLLTRLRMAFIISLSAGVLLSWLSTDRFSASVALGISLACWIMVASVQDFIRRSFYQRGNIWQRFMRLSRAYYGMLSAHIGVAVCVLGITLTTNFSIERDVRMALGEQVNIGSYAFTFNSIEDIAGSNYQGVQAEFTIVEDNKFITQLYPQKKFYTVAETVMGEPGIKAGVLRDLYVALGEPIAPDEWSLRLYYKPFVRWIWLGALLIMCGGVLAASDRRYYKRKVNE